MYFRVYKRRRWDLNPRMRVLQTLALPDLATSPCCCVSESGRWDSNPRPSPWQGDVLPLNYTRVLRSKGYREAILKSSLAACHGGKLRHSWGFLNTSSYTSVLSREDFSVRH